MLFPSHYQISLERLKGACTRVRQRTKVRLAWVAPCEPVFDSPPYQGVSTKGLDDCLLRALVLGCEGTDVAFSFERRGEEAGAHTIRLRRKRSRTMSSIWDRDSTPRVEVDRDATLEQGRDDAVAQEDGEVVIDPPPRSMSRAPDSKRKGLVDADAAVIGGVGVGVTTDGGKVKDARDGGGGGGGGGDDDDSAWLDAEGLERVLLSVRESLEEMTSERDALRRTLEGAALAFKEAAREEMEEAIKAKM